MANRSSRRSELGCTSELFRTLKSRHGSGGHELISNRRRPLKKHIIDNPRNVDQLSRFDQEYQEIQNEADLASISVDTRARSDGSHIRGHASIENHKNKQIIVEAQYIDHKLKTRKRARKKSLDIFQSTTCYSNPSEISLNKLTISAILNGVSGHEESTHFRNYDDYLVNEINMRQVQMSAKAFVDQMFIDRKFINNAGPYSESKPFSNAFDVLNSNSDLFMEMLQKDTKKGTSFGAQPSNNIVIMKPAVPKIIRSEIEACHCSSLQNHQKSGKGVLDSKSTSFSFRELKRKLRNTFGGAQKVSDSSSSLKVGDDCSCRGVTTRDSFAPFINAKIKEKLRKKGLKSNPGFHIDPVCRKLDLSSVKFPNKRDYDVIFEAKRHLSARIQNLNDAGSSKSERSEETLGRILSSPEHEGWPISLMSKRQNYKEHKAEPKVEDVKNIKQRTDEVKYHEEYVRNIMQSALPLQDLNSKNETYITTDGMQSPPTPCSIIDQLDVAHNIKSQEEHQSPVSVLEPFFAECDNSPTSITLQTGTQSLQTPCPDFEECSSESPPSDPPISKIALVDEYKYMFLYVHSVLQASRLNWDKLSNFNSQPEELLHASLFDEVKFLPIDYFFDYKLLFDHMNEVLLQIYQRHFNPVPRLAFIKPETRSLEKLVLDGILKEADFYLLPTTEKKTLDQLVSNGLACSGSWLNIRHYTEKIVNHVSEDVLEELILELKT